MLKHEIQGFSENPKSNVVKI